MLVKTPYSPAFFRELIKTVKEYRNAGRYEDKRPLLIMLVKTPYSPAFFRD